MRSAYKSPLVWVPVVVGLVIALFGHILMATVTSDVKYFFFDLEPGGYMIAGFFAMMALANFIGTRFSVDKGFTRTLPSQLIALSAVIAVLLFFLALGVGIENVIGLWSLFLAASIVVIGPVTAAFIRGMTVPTLDDH